MGSRKHHCREWPQIFRVELSDSQVVKCHIDHVRRRTVTHSQDVSDEHGTDTIQWPSLTAPAESWQDMSPLRREECSNLML